MTSKKKIDVGKMIEKPTIIALVVPWVSAGAKRYYP